MRKIILNEKAEAEYALENCKIGAKPSETIFRIAKYYFSKGYSKDEIMSNLEDFLIRCDKDINLSNWRDIIEYASSNAGKYKLIEISDICVTESEIDKINSLDGALLQRLMFTLVCLAKYGNAIYEKNNSWVNRDHNEIFKLANIMITDVRKAAMINSLCQAEYIGLSKIVDNINLNVKITDDDSPVVLRISDFRNLGNQFRKYKGEDYMYCKSCGLTVKRNSNAAKYCPDCAKLARQKKR